MLSLFIFMFFSLHIFLFTQLEVKQLKNICTQSQFSFQYIQMIYVFIHTYYFFHHKDIHIRK